MKRKRSNSIRMAALLLPASGGHRPIPSASICTLDTPNSPFGFAKPLFVQPGFGIPPVIEELTRLSNGMVLVTGPTGMGKTTTLNYMIDAINCLVVRRSLRSKIRSSSPTGTIAAWSSSKNCSVTCGPTNWRSAYSPAGSRRDCHWRDARFGNDRNCLIAAETGHLVIATLHTPDAAQTIQRIYSVFPAEQQNSITMQLANSVQALIAQSCCLGRRPRTGFGLRSMYRHARSPQSHSRAPGPSALQRNDDWPTASDADHGPGAVGDLSERRNHLRRRPVECPRARLIRHRVGEKVERSV